MAFARKWNFDVAARLLTTLDLDNINDPDSDMGSAMIAVLDSLSIAGNLPPGGAVGEVLRKLSSSEGDADWEPITTSDVAGLATALAGKVPTADLAALAAVVATKAQQTTVDALATNLAAKADVSALASVEAAVLTKASTAALAALVLSDLADVDAAPPEDEAVPMRNASTGQYEPASLAGLFAPVDPGTGQTLPNAAAPFTLFGFIVNEGDDPPAGLPLGFGVPIVGFSRVAAPSMQPSLLDDGFSQNANNVVLTMPQALPVGTKLTIAIVYSAEATAPDNFALAYSGGGVGEATFTTKNAPNTSVGVVMVEVEVTTTVPNGATITVTSRDVGNTPINRTHLLAAAALMPNTADDALDVQKNSGSISSSSTMTVITTGATSSPTTQADEVALGIAGWVSGSGGTTRVLGGTNGWQKLTEVKSDNGSSGRSLALFYLEMTSVGNPNLTTLMTASDNATGIAACQLATFKGA